MTSKSELLSAANQATLRELIQVDSVKKAMDGFLRQRQQLVVEVFEGYCVNVHVTQQEFPGRRVAQLHLHHEGNALHTRARNVADRKTDTKREVRTLSLPQTTAKRAHTRHKHTSRLARQKARSLF